ncbi:AMP-binding protein [Actinomycetospora aeridis]|uniref:AMP-binding protein n=1 Tax=Actinomycetospora aeridis TaxID=3129231 RepID=A0ABU8N062_9PSEU
MSAHVVASRWPAVRVPDLTVPDFLLRMADERPDAPAVIDAPSGRTLTYAELRRDVRRCAIGLRRRGLRVGDVLAIVAPNSPEWLVACLGAMAAGGCVSGINPLYTADEIAPQLRDHGARHVLTIPPFLPLVRAAAAGVVEPDVLVVGQAEGATSFADVLADGADGELPAGLVDPAADLALLPYSSGTTGLAKGVMLTHRAIVTNIEQMQTALDQTAEDRAIAVAPFFHAVGLNVVAGVTLRSGGTLVTLPRFDVDAYLGAIATYRATLAVVVPPIVLAMARHPAVDRHDLSSLRLVGCGAAPLGADLQQECAARVGCPVGQGYGMTEAVAAITLVDTAEPVVPGSAGVLLPGVEARIVDIMTGEDLPAGETGELRVRGPQLMAGYLGNLDATAATIDADGWLHTGDLARFDTDGNLFVDDRLKELVKVKGLQVAPAELEAVLRTHPGVADAAVIPVPDERAGERPKAVVVAAGPVTAAEIVDHVASRVAPHKRITEVAFVDAIPVSPSGKILRRLLVAQDRAGALPAVAEPVVATR